MEEKIIPDGFLGLSVEDQKKYGTRNYQFGYSATVRLECHGPRKVRIMCPIENPESRVISAYKRVGRLLKSAHRMR